tara:strand:- start:2543 stop:2713 length:171 start_codon:yes stop_codon:yes gene_type:complete
MKQSNEALIKSLRETISKDFVRRKKMKKFFEKEIKKKDEEIKSLKSLFKRITEKVK